jgi:capsular exopolysaccharide synthesis family protein
MVDAGAAPTNPDLVKANNQIATTGRRMIDAVESQLESVKARISGLDRVRPAGAASRAAATTVGETREAQLGQELTTTQKLAADLKEELQKARMSEAVEAGQVQIVQLARYPGFRISTQTGRQVMIGLLVGLMFGFGAAVLVDSLDKSIRKRGDIEPMLGIPGLVVIPRLASAGPSRRFKALPSRGVQRAHRSDNQMLDLVTIADPRSPSAEAFRTLRTNLMFSQAVDAMRTLVVTSASPGEGKTITASNLAVAFAQQGMRILLVDCDLRRGRLNRVFGVPREPGMSDLVLGYENEEKVTRETPVAGLYVIPSGKLPPNPAEMLGGQHARDMLAKLTEGYDLVILDTPPLLAASDAAILATLSDGVIMVLRAGSTESAAAQQAMQQLNAIGARVVGAVLNDPESEVAKYGAYYEYNYTNPAEA